MADCDGLSGFVRDALTRGLPRAHIANVLQQAGWSPDQIRSVLAGFAEIEFPIPVPRPKPSLSARDAFMYLLLFSTLYISAFNLGTLVFQFINRAVPDPAAFPQAADGRETMRWSIASLIVAFPIFLYVSALVGRAVRLDPTKRGSTVRRWLTYLTLFVAACVLIGDFISLVYNLLGGDLTMRFVLKVITIGIIAGTIFGYYCWDLRLEEKEIKA